MDEVVYILVAKDPVFGVDVGLVDCGGEDCLAGTVAVENFLDGFQVEDLVFSIVFHLDVLRIFVPVFDSVELLLQDADLFEGVGGSLRQFVSFFLGEGLTIAC